MSLVDQSVVVVGFGGQGVGCPGIGRHSPICEQIQGHAALSEDESASGGTNQTGATMLTEGFTEGTCM